MAFLATGDTYDPDRLTYDRELLREHYLRQGFADFRVLSAVAELAPDGQNFLVTFTLDEGVRYRIGEIAVESDIANVDLDRLRALADTKAGAVYDVRDVNRSITAMTEYLGAFGFAFVEIRPQITRRATDRRLDITFKIGESAKAFVECIDIGGNLRTLDRSSGVADIEGDAATPPTAPPAPYSIWVCRSISRPAGERARPHRVAVEVEDRRPVT